MALTLRPYQGTVIRQIYDAIRGGSNDVLVVAPTGSGKTVMAVKLMQDAAKKGRRALFTVPLSALIPQTIDALVASGLEDYGVIWGDSPETDDLIQIASIQTLERRPHLWQEGRFDLILWDECHTSRWRTKADELRALATWSIGLTATPYRLKKSEGMGDKFTSAVLAPTVDELVSMGSLAPLRYRALKAIDTSKLKTRQGDFASEQLSQAVADYTVIGDQLDGWDEYASHLRTIAFTADIKHGRIVLEEFRRRGYKAEIVTGSTRFDGEDGRTKIFERFEGDEIQVLISCMALSTGFDVPNVECGLLLRPTQSLALSIQQIGRVMRPADGKEFGLILDAAGNVDRLGFPEDISAGLTPENVLQPGKGQEALAQKIMAKKCKSCGAMVRLAAKVCPDCGYEFVGERTFTKSSTGTAKFVELRRLDSVDEHCELYRELIRKAWAAGKAPSSAFADYKKRNLKISTPRAEWARHAIFGEEWDEQDLFALYDLLEHEGLRQKQVSKYRQDWRDDESKMYAWIEWQIRQEFGSEGVTRWKEMMAVA